MARIDINLEDLIREAPVELLIRALLRKMEIGAVLVIKDEGDHCTTYKAGRFPDTNTAVIELHHLTEEFIRHSLVDDQGMQYVWDITKTESGREAVADALSETQQIHRDPSTKDIADIVDGYDPTLPHAEHDS